MNTGSRLRLLPTPQRAKLTFMPFNYTVKADNISLNSSPVTSINGYSNLSWKLALKPEGVSVMLAAMQNRSNPGA